jgi:uncharacterized hydantoinase/oxoprolinase family protein
MEMNPERGDETQVWRNALQILQRAHDDALFEIVQTIAKHVGINDTNGLPIGQFLIQRQREITEHLVSDFADTFPALASQIKAALGEIEREQGYSPLG